MCYQAKERRNYPWLFNGKKGSSKSWGSSKDHGYEDEHKRLWNLNQLFLPMSE